MEKRKMEKLNVETSLLGFGCMRLPLLENGKIDEIQAEEMIDMAYKAGVNYFDTAYPYHNGDSEPFVGKVLNKYDRDSYYLATKLPVWLLEKPEDTRRVFEEQLKRLDKDYVDFYLLHALSKDRFHNIIKLNKVVETCEELQKEGKIRYLGFSFHDDYNAFEEIITSRKWDFCQIQYNYMDTKENPGKRGYELAEKLGVPLVIMEPIHGGSLANFSEDINQEFYNIDKNKSISSYALRWVATRPNVKVVLSGMSSIEQAKDNINTFANFQPFNEIEEAMIGRVVKILDSRIQNQCTGCKYCMPCTAWVDIPTNFRLWNTFHIYKSYKTVMHAWENEVGASAMAKNCVKCGKCEEQCPQHISIREDLVKVQADLDKAKEEFHKKVAK
ncbi:aldo/keto reductase [Lachnospiraceae bacterium ZAX-1]